MPIVTVRHARPSVLMRDRIRSKALFKSGVWTWSEVSGPSSHDAGLHFSEVVSGEESGLAMIAGDAILSVLSSKAAESPTGSRLPSSNLMMCSGSKARAVVEAVNPWKIKYPRI